MNLLIDYALRFVGVPYIYGGKNPLVGLDCSGLVSLILKAGGALFFGMELSSGGIYEFLIKKHPTCDPKPGAVVFFGKDLQHICHVAFCLSDKIMIEAGGGHADTLTRQKAIEHNAFVKVMPIKYRSDYLCSIYPDYVL